jgi:large subunit ribosomal protein L23
MAENKVKLEKKVVTTAALYDILRRPIVSEKTAKLSDTGAIAFEIDARATKTDVVRAMQAIYGIKPTKVNILVVKGKVKSAPNRKSSGTQRDVKKAYVTLPADANLDLAIEAK